MPKAFCGAVNGEVFDEARPRHHAGTDTRAGTRVHVGLAAPAVAGVREAQAHVVLEHMGRQVGVQVEGAPEGNTHRRGVRA